MQKSIQIIEEPDSKLWFLDDVPQLSMPTMDMNPRDDSIDDTTTTATTTKTNQTIDNSNDIDNTIDKYDTMAISIRDTAHIVNYFKLGQIKHEKRKAYQL